METLYYVVEKELQQDDLFEYTTGNKIITVYYIDEFNQLAIFCEIKSLNFKNTENEIQYWLDNNSYEGEEYNFIRL